jgi:hypothetical protein
MNRRGARHVKEDLAKSDQADETEAQSSSDQDREEELQR